VIIEVASLYIVAPLYDTLHNMKFIKCWEENTVNIDTVIFEYVLHQNSSIVYPRSLQIKLLYSMVSMPISSIQSTTL